MSSRSDSPLAQAEPAATATPCVVEQRDERVAVHAPRAARASGPGVALGALPDDRDARHLRGQRGLVAVAHVAR